MAQKLKKNEIKSEQNTRYAHIAKMYRRYWAHIVNAHSRRLEIFVNGTESTALLCYTLYCSLLILPLFSNAFFLFLNFRHAPQPYTTECDTDAVMTISYIFFHCLFSILVTRRIDRSIHI